MCNTVKIPIDRVPTLSQYLRRFARRPRFLHGRAIMHAPRASVATSAVRRPITPEIHYRPDVDGLRAVAVLSVIAFHAFPKSIAGGFIGVDVFFVISGYLISSLILSGLKNGSFSFLDFYARRARRIFPALTVVLIFVWVVWGGGGCSGQTASVQSQYDDDRDQCVANDFAHIHILCF